MRGTGRIYKTMEGNPPQTFLRGIFWDDVHYVVHAAKGTVASRGTRSGDDAGRARLCADPARADCGTRRRSKDAPELLAAAQHATSARPAAAAETQVEEETWRAARPRETRAALDSNGGLRRHAAGQTRRVPALRREASATTSSRRLSMAVSSSISSNGLVR